MAEETQRRDYETPRDGTVEFPRIRDFYEHHIGRNYYIKGFFLRQGLLRDRERKCYPISFATTKAAVSGGPYHNKLSFVASDQMGARLLDLNPGLYDAIVHVNIQYLDTGSKNYPIGYITRIDFEDLDIETVKRYIKITITADGNGVVHPRPQ